MNENKDHSANGTSSVLTGAEAAETADALTGAEEAGAQNALLEGFAEEENDLFGVDETGPEGEDDDDLILEAVPEDRMPAEHDAGDWGGPGSANRAAGANNAAGRAEPGSANDAAGAADAAAGEAREAADAAASGAAQKSTDTAGPHPGEEPRYKVQLYGREQEMTVPELAAAAQRGLEHESLRAQLNAAQQALPALRMVEQYAAANGMTAGQYLQLAEQNMHRQAVEQLTQKGVPEETARELVDERIRLDAQRRAIAPLVQRLNAEEARKKARDPWLEMVREYPDVTTVPESVLLSVQKGERPLSAMRAWELEQLRAKLSAQEMQLSAQAATLKNRQTTPGSAAGAADTKRDAFLDALFGAD